MTSQETPRAYWVRRAEPDDAPAIAEIYNQAIQEGISTYDAFHVGADRYVEYFANDSRYGMTVAEEDSQVIGWASVSPISPRWAYRYTAVGSYFVHRNFRGKGVGNELKRAQIEDARSRGYHSLVVEVLATNPRSIAMNVKHGFRVVGEIAEAGYRYRSWIGLVVMQKQLDGVEIMERKIRFSITTNDLERSISLYRDALGLDMRPLSNAIALFPLGVAEFEVADSRDSRNLVEAEFDTAGTSGLVITLEFSSEARRNDVLEKAVAMGAERVLPLEEWHSPALVDFNGVRWSLLLKPNVHSA